MKKDKNPDPKLLVYSVVLNISQRHTTVPTQIYYRCLENKTNFIFHFFVSIQHTSITCSWFPVLSIIKWLLCAHFSIYFMQGFTLKRKREESVVILLNVLVHISLMLCGKQQPCLFSGLFACFHKYLRTCQCEDIVIFFTACTFPGIPDF